MVNDVVVAVANVVAVAVAILLLLVTFHVAMTSILTTFAISRFSLLGSIIPTRHVVNVTFRSEYHVLQLVIWKMRWSQY